MPANSVLVRALFLPCLCLHMSFLGLCMGRETSLSLSLLYKSTNPIILDSTLMTSLNFNYILKTLSPNTITLGVTASTYECGDGRHHSAHNRQSMSWIGVCCALQIFCRTYSLVACTLYFSNCCS